MILSRSKTLSRSLAESESESDEDTYSDSTPTPKFLAHDICWSRLMKHFDHVPKFDKLMEALQRVLNAFCVADRNEDPDPYQPPIAQEPSFESVMGILQLDNAQKAPSRSSSFKANFENSVASDLDPFLLLSPELRLGIAQYLPTVNFLNLRLSSKAMVLIFDRQDFWKTRFCLYGDRGFLDFLESQSRVLNDLWQQWIHNQMIRDMYLMTGAPGLVPLADNTRDPSLKWTGTQAAQQGFFDDDPPKIDGCLRHYYRQKLFVSKDNCDKFSLLKHARFSQTIALPGRVLAIAVSVFTEGYATYITGLDFIHGSDDSEQVTSFGYRIPGKQVIFDLYGGILTGFDMRIERGLGLLGIRPITTKSDMHYNWAGLERGPGPSYPRIFLNILNSWMRNQRFWLFMRPSMTIG